MTTRQNDSLALVVDDAPVIRLLARLAPEVFPCCSEIPEAADGLSALSAPNRETFQGAVAVLRHQLESG